MQVIQPPAPLEIPVLDLASLPPEGKSALIDRLVPREADRRFDLEKGPLLRILLLRVGPRENLFLATMHHIVSDGWSRRVFMEEMAALYRAFVRDKPSPLPELRVQYADFASWQRTWLKEEALAAHLDYWRAHLDGAPPLIDLPFDRPRPSGVSSVKGGSFGFKLDADTSERLRQLSLDSNVTLFMVLYAGFAILLSRYSNQKDIVVGTPIANRNRIEIESLIGFFVNALVLRCDRIDAETAASSNFTGWPWSYSNIPLTNRLTLAGSNSIPA